MVSLWKSLHFWKIIVLYWQIGLGAFWCFFESFWVDLGVFCELSGALRSTKLGVEICVGIVLGVVCSFFAADDGLASAVVVFYLLRCFLGSFSSSQTDAPTLENVDFTMGIPIFLFKYFIFFI